MCVKLAADVVDSDQDGERSLHCALHLVVPLAEFWFDEGKAEFLIQRGFCRELALRLPGFQAAGDGGELLQMSFRAGILNE